MIAALLALLLAAQAPRPAPALPPTDWSTLPSLMLLRPAEPTTDMVAFVRGEVAQHGCAAARVATGWRVSVDIAVLVTPEGLLRRVVPRAIQCPTVEQYAAGLLYSMARANIDTTGLDSERWYRTTLTFAWGA